MTENNNILELDYSKPRKLKEYFYSVILYFSLIVFFTTLSSYQNPSVWINNNNAHLQSLIEFQIGSLISLNNNDTTQNINDQVNELLVKFYEKRNYNPAWIHNLSTNNHFKSYVNLLDSAKYYGFPFDYFSEEQIKSLNNDLAFSKRGTEKVNNLINIELTTTYSALKYMIYLNQGIIEQDTSANYLSFINTLPNQLNSAIAWGNFKENFLSVQPNLVHHHNILRSLPHFIDLHFSVKFTTPAFINDELLAKSLFYSGITYKNKFDTTNTKIEALYRLQDKYELMHDSILNKETHTVLVSLLRERYFQACLNLHRLRRLNYNDDNYLFVNIPEFKLLVVESSEVKDVFNVIVGKTKTPTPTLTSSIERVIANPYWTVPKSISYGMIAKIRKDSTYLKRHGYFVINWKEERVDESEIDWTQRDPLGKKYWIRQINSSKNALGQVKFFFPNNHSVYLHDTPSKSLFQNENRTYSHGCIRLQNPDKLAQYISDKYTSQANLNIEQLISNKRRHEIELSEKLNIHIQYITCSGSENSDLVFYNDIYNLDKDEIKAVFPGTLEI